MLLDGRFCYLAMLSLLSCTKRILGSLLFVIFKLEKKKKNKTEKDYAKIFSFVEEQIS